MSFYKKKKKKYTINLFTTRAPQYIRMYILSIFQVGPTTFLYSRTMAYATHWTYNSICYKSRSWEKNLLALTIFLSGVYSKLYPSLKRAEEKVCTIWFILLWKPVHLRTHKIIKKKNVCILYFYHLQKAFIHAVQRTVPTGPTVS